MSNGSQMSFDFNAPAPSVGVDPFEIGDYTGLRTEDGRVPYFVIARMMAGPNPTAEEGEFWDRWKDDMKDGYYD